MFSGTIAPSLYTWYEPGGRVRIDPDRALVDAHVEAPQGDAARVHAGARADVVFPGMRRTAQHVSLQLTAAELSAFVKTAIFVGVHSVADADEQDRLTFELDPEFFSAPQLGEWHDA